MILRMNSFKRNMSFQCRIFLRQHTIIKKLMILVFLCFLMYVVVNTCWKEDNYKCLEKTEHERDTKTFLVILILTGPKYYERRDAIRETWMANAPEGVKTFFVIGTKDMAPEQVGTLEYEQSKYEDLLLLTDLKDSYFNLTAKVLQSFRWIVDNIDFKFVFKGDDDTYVRLDILVEELRLMKKEPTYWGFFDGRAHVKKSGQWAETEWVLCDRYLPHARGGGYVLSSDLVQYIAQNAALLKQFNSEDVSVGAWLGGLDVHRVHDFRFDTEYISRGCSNQYIVTHKQDVKMMKEKYQNLKNHGELCIKEVKNRNSYEYNWNVPPSLCCFRNNTRIP